MKKNSVVGQSTWKMVIFFGILTAAATLTACGGGSMKATEEEAAPAVEEVKGSLSRSFSLVDELGRKSGTLKLDPFGGAVLLDESDNVVGKFKSEQAVAPKTMPEVQEEEAPAAE